jgi:hypothetical protein
MHSSTSFQSSISDAETVAGAEAGAEAVAVAEAEAEAEAEPVAEPVAEAVEETGAKAGALEESEAEAGVLEGANERCAVHTASVRMSQASACRSRHDVAATSTSYDTAAIFWRSARNAVIA